MQTADAPLNSHAAPSIALLRGPAPTRKAHEASALGSVRRLVKDEEVFVEGDRAAFYYKVQSGAVRTFKLLSDGRRQIDAFHLPGDIFGMEPGEEHRFSAEAVGDATIVSYRRSNLGALDQDDGDVPTQMMSAVLLSLVRAQNHMLLLGRKNAVEKIATFLLDLSGRTANNDQIDLPMSRTDIADHLGLTIETVSRSLTQLERQGVIELPAHRRFIVLRNRPALERLDM
ncbi:helix-turn-helix domain-containing protein [Microvirga arabica]|uniref:Helix-turn-helix domain-containing protein n=1 Tax=Microvirga arabica TaxID=1128671 RepID=A0ABV6YFR4_9HYPH|nr:helix-turn-helix domain-containing protein [Microvirga arabica]MBM1170810.1 helix-turn-helix domain-containing protein [Microvirga arabica]